MGYTPKAGDIVKVTSVSNPEGITVLILDNGGSMCNSDGEEWWIEWKGKNLATDKYYNVSSRFNNIEKIS